MSELSPATGEAGWAGFAGGGHSRYKGTAVGRNSQECLQNVERPRMDLARARWWRATSARQMGMGLYQEANRERNRFVQGLEMVGQESIKRSLGDP